MVDTPELVQFDKYDKIPDIAGIPCIGEGCSCKKHKKEDEEK